MGKRDDVRIINIKALIGQLAEITQGSALCDIWTVFKALSKNGLAFLQREVRNANNVVLLQVL